MAESSTVVQAKAKKSKIKVVGELSNKLTDQVSKRVRNAVRDSLTSVASQLPLVMSGLSTVSTGITTTSSLFSATLSTIALTATVVSASTVALIEVIDTQGMNTIDATLDELGINLPEEFKDLVQELALNMTAEEIQAAKETLTTDLDVIKNLVINSSIKDDDYSVEKIMQIAYQTTDNPLIKSVAMSLENMSLSLSDLTGLINSSAYLVELSGEKYQTYQNANQSQGPVEVYSVSFEDFFENSNQQFKITWFDPKYGLQEQTYNIDSQNYEITGNYPITINYAASDGNTYTRDYTLIVKDVNETPVFISADVLEINENQNFVVIVSYMDEEQGLVQRTYEIPAGNHEKSDVYLLKSSVVDSGGLVSEYDVAIKILNVNEPAQLVSVSTTTMNENEIVVISALWNDPEDGLVAINYTLPAQDYENNSTYSQILNYVDSNGLSVNSFTNYDVLNVNEAAVLQSFNITSVTENSSIIGVATWLDPEDGLISVSINIPIKDYETDQNFIQELSYVDSGGIGVQDSKLISVLNLNETPYDIKTTATFNDGVYTIAISASDPENDNLTFYQDGVMLSDNTISYTFQQLTNNPQDTILTAKDSNGLSVSITVSPPQLTIIEGVNSSAQFMGISSTSVFENTTTKLTIKWFDPEDGVIETYIDVPALNYETLQNYEIATSVTDSGGNISEKIINLSVLNLNEAATFVKSNTVSILENNSFAVETVWNDPEQGLVTKYDFFNEKYDYETTPNINKTITFTDAGGLVSTANISLNITDVNEKPSAMFWDAGKFSGKASGNIVTINNFNENGNVIGVLEAIDPEGRPVAWSVVNSDGSNVFISNIDPSSPYYNSNTLGTTANYQNGKLLVINSLNYEKDPYREITLRATDEAGNFQDTKVIIYLKDVLEGPQNGDFSQGLSGWIVSGGGSGISGYSYNVSVVNGKAQLEMSGTVGAFGTGYGPSLTSTRFNIDSGELLSFKWTAANTGDDAVMQVYLIDANTGNQTLILNHQGNGSGEYRQIVTQDGDYSLRIVGGSYDASGGTYIGSLITLDDVQIG